MNRRKLFKTLFGSAVAAVFAPTVEGFISAVPAPRIVYANYIPLTRRIWPQLITQELIGVQRMNAPTGTVFYMKVK